MGIPQITTVALAWSCFTQAAGRGIPLSNIEGDASAWEGDASAREGDAPRRGFRHKPANRVWSSVRLESVVRLSRRIGAIVRHGFYCVMYEL